MDTIELYEQASKERVRYQSVGYLNTCLVKCQIEVMLFYMSNMKFDKKYLIW